MPQIKSGKNAAVSIAGTRHRCHSWSVDDDAGEIDTTNFDSEGYQELEDSGVTGCEVTFDADWDVGSAPLVRLTPGALLTNVIIYLDVAATQIAYSFPLLRVLRARSGAEVRGKIRFSATGKSSGDFTRGNN